jgi:hypothetical protein
MIARKILSRRMKDLSLSNAGRDYAETGQQAKCNGPNKPFQNWSVRQKRRHGTGQEVDCPDCNLNRLNRGRSNFFRTHIVALEKSPDRHRGGKGVLAGQGARHAEHQTQWDRGLSRLKSI